MRLAVDGLEPRVKVDGERLKAFTLDDERGRARGELVVKFRRHGGGLVSRTFQITLERFAFAYAFTHAGAASSSTPS